ncbi:MAG: thioredoxin family protein [Flavobacteriaceae bacterium]|nr:thioredoxin family protein [Flavobacteriaceae bacterium]
MKKITLLIFAILISCNNNKKSSQNEELDYYDLIGDFSRSEYSNHPFLKDSFNINYNNYKLDVTTINNIKPYLKNDLKIKIIMGTWCDDSRLLVPQFLKVMDKLKFKKNKIEFIGLDHEKNSPYDHDKIYEIINVPTIIFYKDDMEFNRIVELTIETLEKDILSILSDSGYENAYYGF